MGSLACPRPTRSRPRERKRCARCTAPATPRWRRCGRFARSGRR
jgi:hypothetical protein